METETAALAKFTASKRKIDGLLAQKKITMKDIENLSQIEREYLRETTTHTLAKLKDTERDDFLEKINLVASAGMRSNVWEHNHLLISDAIARHMRQCGMMPAKSAIAEETGLSRQTITKHFNEYKAQPEFIAQMEQFKFMAPKMLANVFKYASSGDMRAARLYFEMVGAINKKQNSVVNEHTNYIQINNTILSQENLKRLTAEELNQIEGIITHNAQQNTRPGEIAINAMNRFIADIL